MGGYLCVRWFCWLFKLVFGWFFRVFSRLKRGRKLLRVRHGPGSLKTGSAKLVFGCFTDKLAVKTKASLSAREEFRFKRPFFLLLRGFS